MAGVGAVELVRVVAIGHDVAHDAIFDELQPLLRLRFEIERHSRCKRVRVIVEHR